jgi:hypothetical protein
MMQTPMLSCPLKATNEIDWIVPLKQYIRNTYGDDPERYADECAALNRLRQDMRGAGKDSAAGRDLLYRYYGQLELLDLRFPVDENHIKISFTWLVLSCCVASSFPRSFHIGLISVESPLLLPFEPPLFLPLDVFHATLLAPSVLTTPHFLPGSTHLLTNPRPNTRSHLKRLPSSSTSRLFSPAMPRSKTVTRRPISRSHTTPSRPRPACLPTSTRTFFTLPPPT